MTTPQFEEDLESAPPSAKLVYFVLRKEGRLTHQELVEKTMLPPRTARHAIAMLSDARAIEEFTSIEDARRKFYEPSGPQPGDEEAPTAVVPWGSE